MSKLVGPLFLLLLSLSSTTRGADCMDWYKHLCIAHEVCLLVEASRPIRNPNYNYTRISDTNFVVAEKKGNSKATIASSRGGQTIEIRQGPFTYVADFKNGQCQNNRGDDLSTARDFNYNWQICESLVGKFKRGFPEVNEAENARQKNSFGEPESDRIKRDAELNKVYSKLLSLVTPYEGNRIIDEISKQFDKENIRFSKTMDGLKRVILKCKNQTELIERQATVDTRRYPAKTIPAFNAQ